MEPKIPEDLKPKLNEMRELAGDLLTPEYDTDFNLIRWLKAYPGDFPAAKYHFLKHLRLRRFLDLDHCQEREDDTNIGRYIPLGLIGGTGRDNRLLVIELSGRIDPAGTVKSVQCMKFQLQRFKFQEKMLAALKQKEEESGEQSSAVYVMDLEHLTLDSTLLQLFTYQYMVLWAHVAENYPEWISKWIIINAPWFTTLLWKAISRFIPEHTREKIHVLGAREEWEPALLKEVHPDCLPVYWGGNLRDEDGDEMCRSKIPIPETRKIPIELYWHPSPESPHYKDMDSVHMKAGKKAEVRFCLFESGTELEFHRYVDNCRIYTSGVYFWGQVEDTEVEKDQMTVWWPEGGYSGLPSTDSLRVQAQGPGVYLFSFGNPASWAWFRSLDVYFRVRFIRPDGSEANFHQIHI